MDIYTLDDLLRREEIIDQYISLIWTERFASYGDFKLTVFSNQNNRRIFTKGTLLACNKSERVMEVKTVEDTKDDDGRSVLNIDGVSLEYLLDDRVAMSALTDLTTTPKWVITGLPAAVARKLFHDICVTGILSVYDIIPFAVETSYLPTDTIAEPADPITVELEPQNLYDAIKSICDTWSLGFRLLRNLDNSTLYFNIYTGNDLTSSQTTLPAVIFTPELDNLKNTSEFNSSANYKNVAYVFSPAGYEVVYPLDVDPEIEGFERHVMVVNATDVEVGTPDFSDILIQRGTEALAAQKMVSAFDGETDPNSQYKYGINYILGDIVEVRNVDGVTNNMRVTEQIFVSDEEGDRAYPTLSVNQFINTGSWLSWKAGFVWADFGPTEYWETAV